MKENELSHYTSVDAGQFRDYLLDKGLSSSSVRRVFSSIKATYNLAASEYGIQRNNPFAGVYLPDLKDVKKRKPVPIKSLRLLQGKCLELDDNLRWIFALVSETGMRLSEAVGLYWSDVHLAAPLPYIMLKPNSHRRLKTENSTRNAPLVGMSLWPIKQAYKHKNGKFLFSRYMKNDKCNANSASAAINKWIKTQVQEDVSVYSLRHSMRNRLRAVQCPTEIIDQCCGWSTGNVGSQYGTGYPFDLLHEWLLKI